MRGTQGAFDLRQPGPAAVDKMCPVWTGSVATNVAVHETVHLAVVFRVWQLPCRTSPWFHSFHCRDQLDVMTMSQQAVILLESASRVQPRLRQFLTDVFAAVC